MEEFYKKNKETMDIKEMTKSLKEIVIKQEKEKWFKAHITELGLLKEIYELRKNTDIFKDNIDELKLKLIESGNLHKRLRECNPQFYGYFCAFIKATKDKLDFKEINFKSMFLEIDEGIKEEKNLKKAIEKRDLNLIETIEEGLMEQYELETGKSAITTRKTVRKDYLKWKKE